MRREKQFEVTYKISGTSDSTAKKKVVSVNNRNLARQRVVESLKPADIKVLAISEYMGGRKNG